MLQLLQPPGSVLQLVKQAGSGHERRPPACQRSLARWPRTPLPGLRKDFLAARSESGLWQADLLTRTCKRSCKDLLERTLLRSPPKKLVEGLRRIMQAPLIDDFTRAPTICFHNDRPVRNLQGPPAGISPGWLQNPFSRTCTGPCEQMSYILLDMRDLWHVWLTSQNIIHGHVWLSGLASWNRW